MAHIWLHLGLGSFHRAHQAYCFSKLLTQGEQDFVLHAGNIRDDAERTVQGLLKQDLSYTLLTIDPQGTEQYHTIKAFSKVIPYEKGLKPLIAEGANPGVGEHFPKGGGKGVVTEHDFTVKGLT